MPSCKARINKMAIQMRWRNIHVHTPAFASNLCYSTNVLMQIQIECHDVDARSEI